MLVKIGFTLSGRPPSLPIPTPAGRVYAQAMVAHESPRTTKLYDRTADVITLDEVERIVI